MRLRKAAELIADSAKPIPVEQAEARDAIWTPDKDAEGDAPAAEGKPESETPDKLWTPGP